MSNLYFCSIAFLFNFNASVTRPVSGVHASLTILIRCGVSNLSIPLFLQAS